MSASPPSVTALTRRLGVRHFLLWMLGCAVVMGLFDLIRWVNHFSDNDRDVLFEVIGGIAYGTAFAGLMLGLSSCWRGHQIASHPGHLLLYLAAMVMVLDLSLTLVLSLLARVYDHANWLHYVDYRQAIGHGCGIVIVGSALLLMRFGYAWRLTLLPLLLLCASQSFWHTSRLLGGDRFFVLQIGLYWYRFPNDVFVGTSIAGAVLLSVVSFSDCVIRRARRDWLHWVGVATWIALCSPHIVHAAMRHLRN